MTKCPACGYKMNGNYNISLEINKLLKMRGKKTIKYLNQIATKVINGIPNENRNNYFRFLFGIKDINDEVIKWGIEQYYQARHFNYGKGFAYLRTIIQNRNQNIDMLRKNERSRLGSVPPVFKYLKTENTKGENK